MLNTAEKMIEKIDYFACGYCTNDLKRVFKGFDKTIVNFYAGVFLIKHKKLGYILYDTGYSMNILKNNLKYFLYRFANPITLKKEDMIDHQLKEKGIDKDEIKYIIISHLHPDHIGGLKFFPNSYLILTKTCYNDFKLKKDSLLIFNELLPSNFEDRLILIDDYKDNSLFPYKNSFDLFSDLSMLIVEVNGHTKGQACLFLPDNNLFIAADVCWGTEFLPFTDKMKLLPRKIQNNFEEYKKGNDLLKKLIENGTIEPNSPVILDEPEVHLHPEWQLVLAEIIVLLQKYMNLNFLINSHSPYFVRAIEVYSLKYAIDSKTKYYLAKIQNDLSEFEDVTGNVSEIYKILAEPLQKIENERFI